MKPRYLVLIMTSLLLISCGKQVANMDTVVTETPATEQAGSTVEETSPDNIDTTVENESMDEESSESAEVEKHEQESGTVTPTQTAKPTTTPVAPISQPATVTDSKKTYTAAEVATHSTEKDCWLILDAKVYDVTKFIPSHPGGRAILRGCGKDATRMFAGHPESAKAMKEKFYIGDLKG